LQSGARRVCLTARRHGSRKRSPASRIIEAFAAVIRSLDKRHHGAPGPEACRKHRLRREAGRMIEVMSRQTVGPHLAPDVRCLHLDWTNKHAPAWVAAQAFRLP
jgi:hypothetical protein